MNARDEADADLIEALHHHEPEHARACGAEGDADADSRRRPVMARARTAEVLSVAPNYLDTLGLTVTSGRGIRAEDRSGAETVALVSEDFAARYFPGQSPLGHRFRVRNSETPQPWRTIVGTMPALGDPAATRPDHNATALVPFDQRITHYPELMIAGPTGGEAPITAIRRAVAEIDPRLSIDRFTTVRGRYEERTWPIRAFGGLFSAFGISGVRRRTAEIGIRMALGADRSRILKMIVRQGMMLLAIGLVLGGGVGSLLGTQLTQLLFNVELWDAPVTLTAFLVLVGAGLAASLVPARRAAAVDPLVALRTE